MALPAIRRGSATTERTPDGWGAHWDPIVDLDSMWNQMSRLFDLTAAPAAGHAWMPLAEEQETADAYLVRAELPGIPRQNINVEMDGNDLFVTGELDEEHQGKVLSRRSGRFLYRTTLPAGIDGEKIEADLSDGILTVRVPKTQQATRRRIQIGGKPQTKAETKTEAKTQSD